MIYAGRAFGVADCRYLWRGDRNEAFITVSAQDTEKLQKSLDIIRSAICSEPMEHQIIIVIDEEPE